MISTEYAAGFFDGEGHAFVGVKKNQRPLGRTYAYYQIKTIITNSDVRPLELLRERWGGTIFCYPTKNPAHSPSNRWILCSYSAVRFLSDILEFLIIKQEVASCVIKLQTMIKHRGRGKGITEEENRARVVLYSRIRGLNKRGPATGFEIKVGNSLGDMQEVVL